MARLIERLKENGDVWIHIDRKTWSQYDWRFLAMARYRAFVDHRYRVWWNHISQVQETLHLLERASRFTAYDYYVLLSGQDYPIQKMEWIRERLAEAAVEQRSFMDWHPIPNPNWTHGGVERFTRRHYKWRTRTWRIPGYPSPLPARLAQWMMRPLKGPGGLALYGGWQWWALHGSSVTQLLSRPAQLRRLLRYFSTVNHPAESFFQTALMNQQLPGPVSCFNISRFHFSKDRSGVTVLLRERHWDDLIESGAWFARKFDESPDSQQLRQRIDRELLS